MSIKGACKQFIKSMTEKQITSDDLFFTLKNEAELQGYVLTAQQRGINGTYISFVKEEDSK